MKLRGAELPVLWHWRAKMPQIGDPSLIACGREGCVAQLVGIGDNVPGPADAGRPVTIIRNVRQRMLIQQALQASGTSLDAHSILHPTSWKQKT